MKNWIAALACLLLLSACNAEEQEQPFSLTAEEQKACAEQIDAVMEEFYWSYDRIERQGQPVFWPGRCAGNFSRQRTFFFCVRGL